MTISTKTAWPLATRVSSGITVLDQVGSTNTWAGERRLDPYSVVLSWNQTEGRGRWNRSWLSRPGESIALSVIFPGTQGLADHSLRASWIPLLAGGSAVRSLWKMGIPSVGAKWPNDVVCDAGKLGGILTEVDGAGQTVIGLGLNVQFSHGPPAPRAISLAELMPLQPGSVDFFVAHFIEELKRTEKLEPADLSRYVRESLVTLGRFVRVSLPNNKSWTGFAEDLDSDGALLVRDEFGGLHAQSASEVEHLYQ